MDTSGTRITDDGVAQSDERLGLGEHPDEVVQPDEVPRLVTERGERGSNRGVDQAESHQGNGGQQEGEQLNDVPALLGGPVDEKENEAKDGRKTGQSQHDLKYFADEIGSGHE